jgi:hypothetical protein
MLKVIIIFQVYIINRIINFYFINYIDYWNKVIIKYTYYYKLYIQRSNLIKILWNK